MSFIFMLVTALVSAVLTAAAYLLPVRGWRRIALLGATPIVADITTSLGLCLVGPDFMHNGYAVSIIVLMTIVWAYLALPVGLVIGAVIGWLVSIIRECLANK